MVKLEKKELERQRKMFQKTDKLKNKINSSYGLFNASIKYEKEELERQVEFGTQLCIREKENVLLLYDRDNAIHWFHHYTQLIIEKQDELEKLKNDQV